MNCIKLDIISKDRVTVKSSKSKSKTLYIENDERKETKNIQRSNGRSGKNEKDRKSRKKKMRNELSTKETDVK